MIICHTLHFIRRRQQPRLTFSFNVIKILHHERILLLKNNFKTITGKVHLPATSKKVLKFSDETDIQVPISLSTMVFCYSRDVARWQGLVSRCIARTIRVLMMLYDALCICLPLPSLSNLSLVVSLYL